MSKLTQLKSHWEIFTVAFSFRVAFGAGKWPKYFWSRGYNTILIWKIKSW